MGDHPDGRRCVDRLTVRHFLGDGGRKTKKKNTEKYGNGFAVHMKLHYFQEFVDFFLLFFRFFTQLNTGRSLCPSNPPLKIDFSPLMAKIFGPSPNFKMHLLNEKMSIFKNSAQTLLRPISRIRLVRNILDSDQNEGGDAFRVFSI